MVRVSPCARLLYVAPENAAEMIAEARWLCKNNIKDDPTESQIARAIRNSIEVGHVGVLEHAIASFEIDMSRVSSHQLVRHRMASYVQESQRAVRQVPEVILPESFDALPIEMLDRVMRFLEEAHALYGLLTDDGMRREDARYVLPQCFTTRVRVTANFRSWMHFLRLRLHPSAQGEIRALSESMMQQLAAVCPEVFSYELLEKFVELPDWNKEH